jgi:hypothetical protein
MISTQPPQAGGVRLIQENTVNIEINTALPQKIDRRKTRRRRPPRKACPKLSEALRLKWQCPIYRAKMQAWSERRRADPTKAWSRRGIGDGATRSNPRAVLERLRGLATANRD